MFKKLTYLVSFVIVLGLIGVNSSGSSLPCHSVEDFDTGDFVKFPWAHDGDESWTITSREKHSGSYSAQAGGIENEQSTTLRVTLDCVSGNITFYRKVSSELRSDYLEFSIDGAEQGRWSGQEDWAQVSFDVTAGRRTFEWTYSKDGSVSEGDDAVWIDDIVFPVDCDAEPAVYDPSLVGWWRLDDERTGTALDYSGNNRTGTLGGDPQWVAGFYGEALEFDGDDYVTIDDYKGITGTRPFSVTAWIKTTSAETREIVSWGNSPAGQRIELRTISNVLRANHGSGNVNTKGTVTDGQWHHIALTVQENATCSYPSMILYLDGRDDTAATTDPDPLDIVAGADVGIGWRSTHSDRYWVGSIDDVRICNPSPADGAVHSQTWVSLSWLPGTSAVSHNVYFGENFDDVAAGTGDTFRSNQTETFFVVGLAGAPYPNGLTLGITYYWRVDEIEADGAIRKGTVWNFKIPEYLLVDDFDSYADTGELLLSWTDGTTNNTGSTISLENEFAGNSIKCMYDNSSGPWYSQAARVYSIPQDWTVAGAKA
jgi:hypothetical protein